MGRQKKDGFEFTRLDVDFWNDIKVRRTKRAGRDSVSVPIGSLAQLVYLRLVAFILKDGYSLARDEDTFFLIAEDLGISEEIVGKCMDILCELDLIDADYFAKGIITSRGIQKQYNLLCEATKRVGKINENSEYSLLGENQNSNFKNEEIQNSNFGKSQNLNFKNEEISSEETPISSEETPIYSEETPISSEETPISSEEMHFEGTEKSISSDFLFLSKEKKSKENYYYSFYFLLSEKQQQQFLNFLFLLKGSADPEDELENFRTWNNAPKRAEAWRNADFASRIDCLKRWNIKGAKLRGFNEAASRILLKLVELLDKDEFLSFAGSVPRGIYPAPVGNGGDLSLFTNATGRDIVESHIGELKPILNRNGITKLYYICNEG